MNADENTCPRCGARRPANAPEGLCAPCLLRLGLEAERAPEPQNRPALGSTISRPRGEVSGAAAARASGVLTALDASIGPVPRVLLRDGSAEDVWPVRPRSEEMPDLSGNPGRYHLIGEIARGGMGAVLKGRDVDLGRDLAVKVILEEHRDHPEMMRRFIEEAQIGGQLQHPGIVPVHEIGQFPDGRLYIAMKLVRGRTLAALLESRSGPDDDRTRFLSIFEQVCQTMAYAHARGVVHRDLKPSNVMVGSFGEIQVMDWGLAKVLDLGGVADEERARRGRHETPSAVIRTVRTGSSADESRAGSVLGTPAYMAPEQARGALDTVDERADVFGLGSILCEILTGQPAYTADSTAALYRKAEKADLADAWERLDASSADAELVALARACLAPAPKDRPRDAGVVLARLTAYVAGVEHRLREAGLARAQAEARAEGERKRRVLTIALAASVLVTALLGAGGWAWVADERSTREAKEARAQAAREAKTVGEVNKALEEAALLRGQGKWTDALAAARRAEALLARGEGGGDLQGRVHGLIAAIARERDKAGEVDKDRRMVERLAAIHDDFAVHLDNTRLDSEYADAFREYGIDVNALDPAEAGARIAARPVSLELAGALDHWTFSRRRSRPPDHEGARQLVAIAKVADPDPRRNRLRDALDLDPKTTDRDQSLAALKELAATADPERDPSASVARLASALAFLGDQETAVSLFRRAQRVHPGDFWINWELGDTLRRAGALDEATRFFSVAVAIRPQSAFALGNLGATLRERGRLEDATETLIEAIRRNPKDGFNHVHLGTVLMDRGQEEKARAEFREARRLGGRDATLRGMIADALLDRGDWNAALAELREAARLDPRHPFVRDRLGMVLLEVGKTDEAIALFRQASRHAPHGFFPPALDNLGRALLANGECDEALEVFRRGHYGSPGTTRRSPSAALMHDAERMVALEAQLPAILKGADPPADPDDRAALARLCRSRQWFAASARLWSQAFAARPELAEDPKLKVGNRRAAAGAAALAGVGQGKDDPPPSAEERTCWRAQALDWLRADLASYNTRLESASPRDRTQVLRRLGLWRVDPALASLRDDAALAHLPEPERRALRTFWSDVDALQTRLLHSLRAATPMGPL